jgi:hypothetical protein
VLSTAFAIAIGVPTANALIDSGSQITADGSVTVASSATSTTNNLARVSQNLGALNPLQKFTDGSTAARAQLAAGLGIDSLTAHTTVSRYASLWH